MVKKETTENYNDLIQRLFFMMENLAVKLEFWKQELKQNMTENTQNDLKQNMTNISKICKRTERKRRKIYKIKISEDMLMVSL